MGSFGKDSRSKTMIVNIYYQGDQIVDRNMTQHQHAEKFKALHNHIPV